MAKKNKKARYKAMHAKTLKREHEAKITAAKVQTTKKGAKKIVVKGKNLKRISRQ